MKKLLVAALLVAAFFCSAAIAHASSAGMVLTMQPGAWAVRDGKKVPLAVKSEIFKGDSLVTDASGRIQVIFADNTTVSLGGDTEAAVADFLYEADGKNASFSMNMAQGMARFVTGKVVEQNRAGFSVTTPQATMGIRGTTFAVQISPEGKTSVFGLDVKSAFPIVVTNIATGAVAEIKTSGMAVDATPSGNRSYKTPPGQFSQSSSSVGRTAVASAQAGNAQNASDQGATGRNTSGQNISSQGSGMVQAVAAQGRLNAQAAAGQGGLTGSAALIPAVAAVTGFEASGASGLYTEPAVTTNLANSAGKSPEQLLADMGVDVGSLYPGGNPGGGYTGGSSGGGSSIGGGSSSGGGGSSSGGGGSSSGGGSLGGGGGGGSLGGGGGGGVVIPPVTPPGPALTASWSGALRGSNTMTQIGTFSFDTHLTAGSGNLTNAQFAITSGYGAGLNVQQHGSTNVSNGAFNIGMKVYNTNIANFTQNNNASMTGNIANGGQGNTVSGEWNVVDNWGTNIFSGPKPTFDGQTP